MRENYLKHLEEQKNEGCNVKGFLEVSKAAGNMNIVPGKFILQNARYVVDSELFSREGGVFNISHVINHLSFGNDFPGQCSRGPSDSAGMTNPLDGETKIWREPDVSGMFEYFIKIVPTIYEDITGEVIRTNQFSVMKYTHRIPLHDWTARGVPGTLSLSVSSDFSQVFSCYLT